MEFTEYLNFVLTNSTKMGRAKKGWLAKSLFFNNNNSESTRIKGFSNGIHYEAFLEIGKTLRYLYENNKFYNMYSLDAKYLNCILTSKEIYKNNRQTQRENFEKFIKDIFNKK